MQEIEFMSEAQSSDAMRNPAGIHNRSCDCRNPHRTRRVFCQGIPGTADVAPRTTQHIPDENRQTGNRRGNRIMHFPLIFW